MTVAPAGTLLSGSLAHPIRDPRRGASNIWAGTASDGEPFSSGAASGELAENCDGWTSSASHVFSVPMGSAAMPVAYGSNANTDHSWTSSVSTFANCNMAYAFYCFETPL